MAWLLAFAMVLVLSPFQALAEENENTPAVGVNEEEADTDNRATEADGEQDPKDESFEEPQESPEKASVSGGKDMPNEEDIIKKELAGLKLGIDVTPRVNLGEDGKATGVEIQGAVKVQNTFKTQLAHNPFQGSWKFTVKDAEGKEVDSKKQQNFDLSASETLNVTEPGKYTAVVDWEAPFGITQVSGEAPFTIETVEEPGEEDPGDGEDPGEETPALPESLDVTAVPEIDEEGFYTGFVRVKGKIDGAKKGDQAKGKWKFVLKDTETGEVVDKEVKRSKKGIRKGAWLAAFESGTYEAKVVFNGTFNGEALKVKGSTELTLEVPDYAEFDHEVKYEYKDGKHRVTASILEGEHATGLWLVGLFDMDGNPVVDPAYVEFHEGKTFTAEFKDKLKPGHYFVGVVFEGAVDGQPGGFIDDSVEFEVKDGKSITKPGKDDDKDPVKPGEPKKVIDEVKNGGKMPKTATQYPLGMMVGGGILLLGLMVFGIMKFRRTAV